MRRVSFRLQMLLSLALPSLGMAAFFSLYFPMRQEEAADQALVERARAMGMVLNASLVMVEGLADDAGVLDSSKDIQRQFESVAKAPDLLYVALVKNNGSVPASYRVPGVLEADQVLEVTQELRVDRRGGLVHVLAPVTGMNGALLGTLVIGLSRDSIATARRDSQRTALLVGALIFAAGLLLGWLVSRTIARPVLRASRTLDAVAADLVAAAREQEASAAEGASAVEETRRTMEALVGAAQHIAENCTTVLTNAEHSLDGSHTIAERIAALSAHAEKVAEILASIMQIADRTDLLALNAALEGTKAGEAGKGFTLVAGEMRRLAESVMESVTGIRRVMKDVREASQGAVDASRQATHLSEATTGSAREIALVAQQQRRATEQVSASMDEMTELLNHNVASIQQTTRSAAALGEVALRLSVLVRGPSALSSPSDTHAPAPDPAPAPGGDG